MRIAIVCLLLLATSVFAQEGVPLFTTDFPPEEFAARRAKVYEAIGETGVALIQGAPSPAGYARFRQSNEMYYLSGIEVPHAYLLLSGSSKRATIFLPHRHESRERVEGKMLSVEDAELVRKLTGIENVMGLDRLSEILGYTTMAPRVIWTPLAPSEGMSESRDAGLRRVSDIASDPWDGRPSREGQFVALLRARYPQFEIRDLTPTLDALRLIKSERELVLIRKATRASCQALLEAMRSTVPGIAEYELDAVAKYIFFRNGAQGEAYYSLVASGPNAIYPHYSSGKRVMKDGDLVLMDYAPDMGYYMSDITRMWPVNGKFNDWQRELYGFYLATYRAILDRIRPGATAADIRKEAAAEMDAILARTKFSKKIYEEAAKGFVDAYRSGRGGLGHWVGMATHDVGRDAGPLRPGMVFTIEPQFRVPEENIYIRLEDLIIIGKEKAEIVSDFLPMDIAGIEKVMREEGILQRYPAMK
jgi:Xaa-Pro aminopeptidase